MLVVKKDNNIKKYYTLIEDADIFYNILFNGNSIGFGAISFNSENMICIYIKEEYRGNGYGTEVFSIIVKELKNMGINKITLLFESKNIRMRRIVNHYAAIIKNQDFNLINYEVNI